MGALRGGQPVPIAELARRRDIPLQFLEQLFATLRRAGMLQSQRARKGGYTFTNDPSELRVLAGVELLDGELGADIGADSGDGQDVWARSVAALREVLGAPRLRDVVRREADAAGAPMYRI